MDITYKLIRVDGTTRSFSDTLRGESGTWYDQLKAIFASHFEADIELEHVNVWHNGAYTDMFVDETGALKKLPVNPIATEIYQANVKTHFPDEAHDDLPLVYGDVLLFDRKVWF